MALNGGNGGNEGIRSYLTGGLPGPGGPPTQNRRRAKNSGNYYGSSRVSESGDRSYQARYQPRRHATGASGDGSHNVYNRNGEYSESQAQSPTGSQGSGRSGQVLASSGGYHQYPSKDYEHRGEFRQRGDHHHYNHRQGQQSQQALEHVQTGSQITHSAGGPINTEISSLLVQPCQEVPTGGHFPPQQSQATPVLAPFPAPPPAQIQAHPQPFGFYGLHPNSQPMFGSLALCHIPFGINPSSVISPIVYTQIIGSGMITPGLAYNMAACPVPNPFMQPPSAPTGSQFIIQHTPQQGPQPYPQYHHHTYQQQPQFQMQAQQQAQVVHHHHNSNPTSSQHNIVAQPAPAPVPNSAEECIVFDSSSLLNPDADAFFPPEFPPTRPSTAEGAPSEQNTQLVDLGADDDPDLDSKITEIESGVQRVVIVDDTGNDGGDEDDVENPDKSEISLTTSAN